MQEFKKYFTNDQEYPSELTADEILPYGTLYHYVSNSFLNGFINYGNVIAGRLLNRYHQMEDVIDVSYAPQYQDPPHLGSWVKPKEEITKKELFDIYVQPGRLYSARLDAFQDDVLVLQKVAPNRYIFYWFDQDGSDCSIGRFETTDSEQKVLEAFAVYQPYPDFYSSVEIPLHFFTGWMSG